jgi:diguanylate cyclase (GGDEF)-like protein/PAS domain S-box-containing protein
MVSDASDSLPQAPQSLQPSTEPDRKALILLVDDETFNLKLLRAHLTKHGFDTAEAANGEEALLKVAGDPKPELILLDIMMPGMDGLEVCRRLKQDSKFKDIPIIFLSALSDANIKSSGLLLGGVDFISKPFDSRELVARVKTHLTIKRQAEQITRYAESLETMVEERTSLLRQAEAELHRDYNIQSITASLLRLSLDERSLQSILLEALYKILGFSSSAFLPQGCIFLNEDGRLLKLAAQVNLEEKTARHCAVVPFGQCVCGMAAKEGKILILDDEDKRHEHTKDYHSPHGHICAPIFYEGRLLGVLNVLLVKGHAPDAKEIEFISTATTTLGRIVIYKEARDRLERSERQYRAIFENTGSAMAIVEADATLSLVNTRFAAYSGMEQEAIQGKTSWTAFAHPEDRDTLIELRRALSKAPETPTPRHEFRFVSGGGIQRDMALVLSSIPGGDQHVASLVDITDKKEAERLLLRHAFYDALTGLPNRTFLLDRLAAEIERTGREPEYDFAFLLLDLDRFNLVNESLGHDIGDALLVQLAHRLELVLAPSDLLARLGGDEFGVLRRGVADPSNVSSLADRIQTIVKQPFLLQGQELVNTCSMGIALSAIGYARGEDVLRDADTALFRAKQQGKARAVIFDRDMHRKASQLLQLVTDMRQAIKRNEFILHYQPIVDLKTLAITGFESLVRWIHPQRGMVSPGEFIPEAEESGLIIPIGRWVLEESCRCMKRMCGECGLERCLVLSVNLSGKQFTQERLFEMVRDTLEATGFEPSRLKLEITESVIMEDAAAAVEVLRRLKSLNIQLSIDDFGTGYSSLSYLHRFPVDMIKIDRSFVSAMGNGGENLEIVRTIVNLAHNLHMKVIAEGVETKEQLDALTAMDCAMCQGFYFSKPVPEDVVLAEKLCSRSWRPE